MTVFDVLVNTDDLVVLGPPDVVDVSISVGEKGNRGATFYTGQGSPNLLSVSENIFGETLTPIAGDIFINNAIGPEYGWLYIYNPKVVGNQWDQILSLQPTIYASIAEVIFSSGSATVSIPLSNILTNPTGISVDNFIVDISPENSVPSVVTISSKSIVADELIISINGIEFVSSAWQNLNKTIDLNVNIKTI